MPDYQCFPLWDITPETEIYGDIHPNSLLISKELQEQIINWAVIYDSTLNHDDPAASDFLSLESKNAFLIEGARLATQLQEELGAEFTVVTRLDHL